MFARQAIHLGRRITNCFYGDQESGVKVEWRRVGRTGDKLTVGLLAQHNLVPVLGGVEWGAYCACE